MTNLTRLRLILVDLSGLMQKRTHLKQNVLFFNPLPSAFFPSFNLRFDPHVWQFWHDFSSCAFHFGLSFLWGTNAFFHRVTSYNRKSEILGKQEVYDVMLPSLTCTIAFPSA